jgi:aminoglycoside phosphotransferase (APT) family kinase protein
MHADEVDIDDELVRRLVATQFPRLADLPIRAVRSTGTVNAIYRLGDQLYARLPRVAAWAKGLDREWEWLPRLAPQLSLQVPEPVARGRPTIDYPFSWGIYRWIEGQPYTDAAVVDERQAAKDLAEFVLELRHVDLVAGAPHGGRDPLRSQDAVTREAIDLSAAVIDRDATIAAWEQALESPAWEGTPVWIHCDLLRPNLLVRDGRLCAVIDFGAIGVGDPAADVTAAWSVFGPTGRQLFRAALAVDDDTWNRARGFAILQMIMIIPYYPETNPEFVAMAKRTIEEIIVDRRSGPPT